MMKWREKLKYKLEHLPWNKKAQKNPRLREDPEPEVFNL